MASDEAEFGMDIPIYISGSKEAQEKAKEMIEAFIQELEEEENGRMCCFKKRLLH